MILKDRDKSWRILARQELELLLGCQLTDAHRSGVELEKLRFQAGEQGEQDTAHYLDVQFRDSKNWVVLHDLRLDDGDDVAQIDHLIINRLLNFFVLETKNYKAGQVRISSDGEFSVRKGEKDFPIPSPIAQNARHIMVLERILKRHELLPNRLLSPVFRSYVLFHHCTRLQRQNQKICDSKQVMKADLFYNEIEKYRKENVNIVDIMRIVGQDTLEKIGRGIMQYHNQKRPNYLNKFCITNEELKPLQDQQSISGTQERQAKHAPNPEVTAVTQEFFCFKCRKPISKAEAYYCFQRKQKYGGRAYCREHQNAHHLR